MTLEKQQVQLNRGLFIGRQLDSSALTPTATLLHRFTEPGQYELFVRADGQLAHRQSVQVVGKLGEPVENASAAYQINLDLTSLATPPPGCDAPPPCVLNTGGVIGFYVSEGTAAYTVSIVQFTGEKKVTVLDSAQGLPEGDFFAVTLLRPGAYIVTNTAADARMKVAVATPKRDGYRPDQATLVQAARGAFDPAEASLVSGQTLVFQCQVPSRFVVELTEPAPEPQTRAGGRPRHTVRKRRPPTPPG